MSDMRAPARVDEPVTLANCEDEPIHLPGAIQPHGALIALDVDRRVVSFSENLPLLLGFTPLLNEPLDVERVGVEVVSLLDERDVGATRWSNAVEAVIGDSLFDVVGHFFSDVLYLEFEPRPAATAAFTAFALNAQRIIGQVQQRHELQDLLVSVTEEIRRMTGYDRVMAYRFKPDLSGEVVAEARREDLESYLGQRYPASDIPAQARRLYIENPIRLIADVSYRPARLVPDRHPRSGKPFDLSFSTLRSVSPIHCEYLSNMGVAASMSISIVVGGELWGLFSCHHMTPKQVPYPVRMAFQVFSQVCSAVIERLEASKAAEAQRQAAELQLSLVRHARDADDMLGSLSQQLADVAQLLPCHAAAVTFGGRLSCRGDDLLDDFVRRVVQQLELDDGLETFYTDKWPHLHPQLPEARFCGVLAIRFHRQASGWILWFRLEEVQTINWGGKPEKIVTVGPSGSRLTPRGSFEAWEEVVSGSSAPWTAGDLSIAEKLRVELMELCLNRASEIDRMRQRLIAVLGHDLRNPLQSISMAAAMLSSNDSRTAELRQHITNSSGRMERLISQILEMSRLQAGAGITVQCVPTDFSRLVADIVNETCLAYPGLAIETAIAPEIMAHIDPDRMAQVVANLLSNARHHGAQGRPVQVRLSQDETVITLAVINEADFLSEERLGTLFTPFKQPPPEHGRNKSGLGIGLYISQAIVLAHGGTIDVSQAGGRVTFRVCITR